MCVNFISSFGGPTQALSKLLQGAGVAGPCLISSITDINNYKKGREYVAVQVTCKDKSIYRIEAYGGEAVELRNMAKLHHEAIEPSESLCRHEFCQLERIKNKNYKCDLHCSFWGLYQEMV